MSKATEIDIGQGQPTGELGGCADPAPQCVYVQETWDPDQVGDNPDGLPFGAAGVVTHVRIRFYSAGGTVIPRVVRFASAQPETYSNTYSVRLSGAPLSVSGPLLDAAVRLPVQQGDTLAFSLSGGAKPYVDWEPGSGRPGHGDLYYSSTDGDAQISGLKGVCLSTSCLDGLVLHVTSEPDADADGFGDDTQDPCPARAGAADGCNASPPPGGPPAPGTRPQARRSILQAATLRHRRLDYTLARRARVTARLDRRRGQRWLLERRVRLPGAAGRHHVAVPRTRHRVSRVVVEVRSLAGRLEGRAVLALR